MKNFVIQNVYSDVLNDEQFAKIFEALYDTIAIVSLEKDARKLNSIILEATMVIELRRKLCKNEKGNKITECSVIEKGKIECRVADKYNININDIARSWLFRRAIELISKGELCNMDVYQYGENLWKRYIEETSAYLDTVIGKEEEEVGAGK